MVGIMANPHREPRIGVQVIALQQTVKQGGTTKMENLEEETGAAGIRTMVNCQRLAIFMTLVAFCLPAHADNANDAFKHGMRAERQADYDSAYSYYKQAHTLVPDNPKYLAAYMHMRMNAASQHVHTGQVLRNTGALTDAMVQFQRAAEIDASSFVAQQELRRTADMIRRQERLRAEAKTSAPAVKPAGRD